MDLFIDLETPFGTGYNLKTMNYDEYIFDERFKIMGFAFAVDDGEVSFVSQDNAEAALSHLSQMVLDFSPSTVICHNTYFDGAILAWKYGMNPDMWADTMSMFRLTHYHESASLSRMAEVLFPDNEELRKGQELVTAYNHIDRWPEEHREALIDYTIQDVRLLQAAYYKLRDLIPSTEYWVIDDTLRKFFYPTLMLDGALLEEEIQAQSDRKEDSLAFLGVTSTQLSSNNQFAELLMNEGVMPPKKLSQTTGKLTFAFSKSDPGFLSLQNHPSSRVRDLVEGRLLIKSSQVETRARTLLRAYEAHDGKCPIPLRYAAAHTLRFGGMDKRNFQNFPRQGNLRNAIVPPPGEVLYIVDYSAIEARVLAYLAEHTVLLDRFRRGEDVYIYFAAEIYNKPPEEITKQERFLGKVAILGLGYGMGAPKFHMLVNQGMMGPPMELSMDAAIEIVRLYRSLNRPVPQFWKNLEDILTLMIMNSSRLPVEKAGFVFHHDRVIHPNGTYISYPQRDLHTTFGGKITENLVQFFARNLLVQAMITIYEELGLRSAFHVHDELIFSIPEEEQETLPRQIENCMINHLPQWAEGLPVAVEGSIQPCYTK